MDYVRIGKLSIATPLHDFVRDELLPLISKPAETFWGELETLLDDLEPVNREVLDTRDQMQQQLDRWHRTHPGATDTAEYQHFLEEIGYIVAAHNHPTVSTENVDPELAQLAGPQLVVPVLNARFLLNAANARWGSLYDALYGSDVIPDELGAVRSKGYDPARGQQVIDWVRDFLDASTPLAQGSHHDAVEYRAGDTLEVALSDGSVSQLADPQQYVGFANSQSSSQSILLRRNGLHLIIDLDRDSTVGTTDPAGVCDVRLEAALTTIVDFEDSIAAVDPDDKVAAYRNWLEINRGTLVATVAKGGTTFERSLRADLAFTTPQGIPLLLRGTSLLLVRNVGHLMTTEAVLHDQFGPIHEGILDAVITSLAALSNRDASYTNSSSDSIYIVKPKMHGPAEVALTNELFGRVETLLGLQPHTLKMGIMDEERRTSVNLAACIGAAASRVVFINTGFLDRTGDEIHSTMHAGPVVAKATMKQQPWISAYEALNVSTGLAAGLSGRGQIGKGMWAMPDLMRDMYEQKIDQVRSGANTAWVPSPTAAVIHAMHYHLVNVAECQVEVAARPAPDRSELLRVPILDTRPTPEQIQTELDNNAQSILGYVVRWIDQGIGCSKVPDINEVALMEDRATLRISSQLLANWLLHGVIHEDQVQESFRRMAVIVDQQNATDPHYRPMGPDFTGHAFRAALELVLQGGTQPNGYTEPILHRYRQEAKARQATEGHG